MDDFAKLANLGPKSAEWFAQIGITTFDQFEELGAVAIYQMLEAADITGLNPVALYALEGALCDAPWTDLPPGRREELLREIGREDLIA